MTTTLPAEAELQNDSGDPPPSEPAPTTGWFEARIPAVFVAVLATWVLIVAFKVIRQFMR